MTNLKAKILFPTWYKSADITSANETRESRIKAINGLIENQKKEFWMDIVCIHLGLEPHLENTLSVFVKAFLEQDTSFQVINNANLIRVLACCALCFKLEDNNDVEDEETANLNTALSLAVLNLNFLGQFKNDLNIPVSDYAKAYLGGRTYNERLHGDLNEDDGLEDLMERLEEGQAMDQEDNQIAVKSILKMRTNNTILSEELNVLSWIFGGYSKPACKFFSEAGPSHMIGYGVIEFSNKTEAMHYVHSAKAYFHQILSVSNAGKKLAPISVINCINALPPDLKENLLKEHKGKITEATPFLYAILKASEHNAGDDFSPSFKKITNGGDIKKTFKPEEISTQLYNELVFLKSLKNA